ncbi:MAG: thiamine phosphate synthase [Gemmatimonadetes bacterium]|nr:thiamine phosphate synthase [Gemmatimonadota bacterium]
MTGHVPGARGRAAGLLPRLHVVTDDSMLARGGFEARAIAVLEAGGAGVALHLRGPRTDGSALYRLASDLLPHARRSGTLLVVNDRLDVALALEVDGVHVGQRSLGVRVARGLLGPDLWLGASVHDAKEASAAREEGADYAFLGTMFETPTHPGRVGMGIEGLAATVRVGGLPIVAIGGIDPARVPEVLAAGAYGVAVVRGVWDAPDAVGAVRRYRQAIEDEREAV